MALYRLEAKIIGRKEGRSVIAAAAYRAGTKIKDELRDKVHDYTRRAKGVIESAVLVPEGAPEWAKDSAVLWNKVEAGEKRKDAQLAREFILSVPVELNAKEQFQAAVDWVNKELVSKGMAVEVSLHHDKKGINPHVHALATMRRVEPEGFGKNKPREWNDKALLVKQRESWANALNAALEKANRPERVDHRSLKDRGKDQLPQPKLGYAAVAMKRKGIDKDPKRYQLVRRVKMLNEVRPMMRSLRERGEVSYWGIQRTWLKKSSRFMAELRERAARKMKTGWGRRVLEKRREGPDMER